MLTTKENSPAGLKLLATLEGHEDHVFALAWNPTGEYLASASNDGTVRVWDWRRGKALRVLSPSRKASAERQSGLLIPQRRMISSVAWSSKGKFLACGVVGGSIVIWNDRWKEFHFPERHTGPIYRIGWSPNGDHLASCSEDGSIRLWANVNQLRHQLRLIRAESCSVLDFAWSPDSRKLVWVRRDGKIIVRNVETGDEACHALAANVISVAWRPVDDHLAAGADDSTIRILDGNDFKELRIVEGHTSPVHRLAFSHDGQLLVSSAYNRLDALWRCDTWELISAFRDQPEYLRTVAFHPRSRHLATISSRAGAVIRLWQLDRAALFSSDTERVLPTRYANAKVVLVGDTGVGKSALSLVLSGKPFKPTVARHGRRIWTFERQNVQADDGSGEIREILLWDLAGHSDDIFVHQLNLNHVAVALVVYDASWENSSAERIRHWVKALHQAERLQDKNFHPLVKILVGARADCASTSARDEKVEAIKNELGFNASFETSARTAWHIPELIEAIRGAIVWDSIAKVPSNRLFQEVKQFLVGEKKAGRLLCTMDELHRGFRNACVRHGSDSPRPDFDICIESLEGFGLVRRLRFGGYVLMQPDLLDAYASAIVQAAKLEPEGLGYIAEQEIISANFKLPTTKNQLDKHQGKILLIAAVEELLRSEVGFREYSEDRINLVFPSQSTLEKCESSAFPQKCIVFSFEGAVMNVFSTLIVRLAKGALFQKKQLWQNAASFDALVGGTCALLVRENGDSVGEISLCFDERASESTRYQFESYVLAHLNRRAQPGTVVRSRLYDCRSCGTSITKEQAEARRARGFETLECPVCGLAISLKDGQERLENAPPLILEGVLPIAEDKAYSHFRDKPLDGEVEVASEDINKKDYYDVFLCHNRQDKGEVKRIARKLRHTGLSPWLDEWEIRPGGAWQSSLIESIKSIRSAAVFIGPHGVGPWQDMEQSAILQQFLRAKRSVIPVVLPGVADEPEIPLFLQSFHMVDFRTFDPDPMEQLIWGITGERPA